MQVALVRRKSALMKEIVDTACKRDISFGLFRNDDGFVQSRMHKQVNGIESLNNVCSLYCVVKNKCWNWHSLIVVNLYLL